VVGNRVAISQSPILVIKIKRTFAATTQRAGERSFIFEEGILSPKSEQFIRNENGSKFKGKWRKESLEEEIRSLSGSKRRSLMKCVGR